MEKKSALLLLSLLMAVATGAVRAQTDYHSITDGCTWSVSNEKYMTHGDTVLNGKTYLKLYRQVKNQPFEFDLDNAVYFAAIRDDSAEKKVYAYLPAGTWVWDLGIFSEIRTDTAMEVLIYDFSLNIGDTVNHYILGDYIVKSAAVRVAATSVNVGLSGYSIVSHQYSEGDTVVVLSDNSTRHRVFLHGIFPPVNITNVWIDGVGSIRGFNEGPQTAGSDYGYRTLLCFSDSSGASFQTDFDFDNISGDCFNNGFGGDVPDNNIPEVKIYPNPTAGLLYIELRGAGIAGAALYDLQGRVVETMCTSSPQGTATLNVRSVPAGVYLLRVRDTDGKEYQQKIVRN